MPRVIYHCECGETCSEHELETALTSAETRFQPAEYDAFCPNCGNDWENMEEEEC